MEDAPLILLIRRRRWRQGPLPATLAREGYRTIVTARLKDIDNLIKDQDRIALALVDVSGFNQEVWESCSQLHEAGIPYMVLVPYQQTNLQLVGPVREAQWMMVKPLHIPTLMTLVRYVISTSTQPHLFSSHVCD